MISQHLLTALNPVSISAVLIAILLAATRLAPFTKPYWTFFPKVVQAWFPSVVAGLPMALSAFGTVKTWLDFAQALLIVGTVPLALAAPGISSPHNHPPAPSDPKPKLTSVPPIVGGLCIALLALLPGCGLFAAAAPYLAEAAVVIADAGNAVSAAEATHLIDPDLIARARAELAAAAKADDGLKGLTSEQLDASLADFRAAWAAIQQAYAAKRVGAAEGDVGLPVPLAIRRAHK